MERRFSSLQAAAHVKLLYWLQPPSVVRLLRFFLSFLLWITLFVVCYFSHPYSAYFHESLKVLAAAIQAQSIFTDRLLVYGFLINKWPIVSVGQRGTQSGSTLILNSNAAVDIIVWRRLYLTVTVTGRFRQQGSGGSWDWTYRSINGSTVRSGSASSDSCSYRSVWSGSERFIVHWRPNKTWSNSH